MIRTSDDLEAQLGRLGRRYERHPDGTFVLSLGANQPPAALLLVPPVLVGLAFLGEVSRVLTEDGLLAANLIDAPPFPVVRAAVAALRAHFPDVTVGVVPATLKKRHGGNVVVLAGRRVPVAWWSSVPPPP